MAKCKKCGAELAPGKKFCGNCGYKASIPTNEYKNEVYDNLNNKKIISIVYSCLAIIGLIILILGLFTKEDFIELFYYYPIYRLIDIIAGFILLLLGTILLTVNLKK